MKMLFISAAAVLGISTAALARAPLTDNQLGQVVAGVAVGNGNNNGNGNIGNGNGNGLGNSGTGSFMGNNVGNGNVASNGSGPRTPSMAAARGNAPSSGINDLNLFARLLNIPYWHSWTPSPGWAPVWTGAPGRMGR